MLRSVLASSLILAPFTALGQVTPERLRCEYLENPIEIEEPAPRLSWIDTAAQRDAAQAAYRILVSSSREKALRGEGDLWDSGRVNSAQSSQIEYRGRRLNSSERAWWRVTVWDRTKGESRTSKPAFWEMGLLAPADWRAKWLSMPDPLGSAPDLSGTRWIWYPEGQPSVDAPSGVRLFRTKFSTTSGEVKRAVLGVAVDDSAEVTFNGNRVFSGSGWTGFNVIDVTSSVRSGENSLQVKAFNDHSRAGLALVLRVTYANGSEAYVRSNGEWQTSIDGQEWRSAQDLAGVGEAPYGNTKWSSSTGPSPFMRTEFSVRKPILRARVYATAKGLYKLFLDGKRVGDGVFTPGWTDYRKRIQYQTYDVTSMLREGSHAVGMMLGDGWYCGHVGLTGGQNYGERPEGLAQIRIEYRDGTVQTLGTDESWKIGSGPIVSSDLLMGETYDARAELAGWTRPGFDATTFARPTVKELGDVPLVAQQSPVVQQRLELKPKTMTHPKRDSYVFDLGQNMVGWARLRVRGAAGTRVRLRFAEMLNPDGTIYTTNLRGAKATDEYTLRGGGNEVYEPSFTFHGFRYIEVSGYPGVPSRDAVTGVVVSSIDPSAGTFACSSPLVNQLQSNIVWGQRGNYLEVPTDCPQRDERLGWMGDAQIFARTATYNADVAAFLTKWLQDVADAQSPAGGFSDVSPRMGAMSDGSPAWGDAGVIVPWTLYRVYGDKRILERMYPSMRRWIEYIDSANPDHIWTKRSNANYGDWLNVQDDTPRDVLATAYFAHSTDLLARIASVTGDEGEAQRLVRLRDQIRKAFCERFVDGNGLIKGDTQTDYVLALAFDLIPEEARAGAAKRLSDHILVDRKGHLSTGFVGVGYLNPTLTAVGRSDIAYKLLLNDTYPSWGYSIRQGATTIWERWDGWTQEKGFQNPGMNSFNHYSLGSVGEWMFRSVAGIDLAPGSAGFDQIVIHPVPTGDLKWARGTYDSIRGPIRSGWRQDSKRFVLDVTIPANTTATVYLPAGQAAVITENGADLSGAPGIHRVDRKPEGAVLTIGSGTYRFVVQS